jgi:hypothetical protein
MRKQGTIFNRIMTDFETMTDAQTSVIGEILRNGILSGEVTITMHWKDLRGNTDPNGIKTIHAIA